jgi:hypothetical protein
VNITVRGVRPVVGLASNCATGTTGAGFTVIYPDLVTVLFPAVLLAVSDTVKFPAFRYV